MGVLTVKLIKASNLKDADFLGKTDPYVKMELEQDNVVSIIIFVDAYRIEFERKVMPEAKPWKCFCDEVPATGDQ